MVAPTITHARHEEKREEALADLNEFEHIHLRHPHLMFCIVRTATPRGASTAVTLEAVDDDRRWTTTLQGPIAVDDALLLDGSAQPVRQLSADVYTSSPS